MSNPAFTESGDSADLQALFDSIASSSPAPVAPAAPVTSLGDSDELQALFDSVASTSISISQSDDAGAESKDVYNRVGSLARQLHESLRGLGYDQALEQAAHDIPDAKQRLAYVAELTEQSANRVLAATEIARPLQDDLLGGAEALQQRWERMFNNQLSVDEFKALAMDTRQYFNESPAKLRVTNEQLMEIMMAQDFQDLTGQVIKRVVELAQGLERQLLNVLIETMPEERRAAAPEGLMNGPVITSVGRTDVVTSQEQVDDLLESLGF